jgi:hypothetical protein
VRFAFVGGRLLANRRRVSRMEFCGVGFISCMFGVLGCSYCVEVSIIVIAHTDRYCCLENDQLEDWWIYRVRVSEIA